MLLGKSLEGVTHRAETWHHTLGALWWEILGGEHFLVGSPNILKPTINLMQHDTLVRVYIHIIPTTMSRDLIRVLRVLSIHISILLPPYSSLPLLFHQHLAMVVAD